MHPPVERQERMVRACRHASSRRELQLEDGLHAAAEDARHHSGNQLQVLVEGVRLIKKHQRKTQDNPNGAIIQREGPIHISNVKIVERAGSEKDKNKKADYAYEDITFVPVVAGQNPLRISRSFTVPAGAYDVFLVVK